MRKDIGIEFVAQDIAQQSGSGLLVGIQQIEAIPARLREPQGGLALESRRRALIEMSRSFSLPTAAVDRDQIIEGSAVCARTLENSEIHCKVLCQIASVVTHILAHAFAQSGHEFIPAGG